MNRLLTSIAAMVLLMSCFSDGTNSIRLKSQATMLRHEIFNNTEVRDLYINKEFNKLMMHPSIQAINTGALRTTHYIEFVDSGLSSSDKLTGIGAVSATLFLVKMSTTKEVVIEVRTDGIRAIQ